jgi:ketosteroid isomerase-like protein
MPSDDVEALLDLERRRCEAISAADGATLTAMLDDDYIHVHLNGFEDDRTGHVQKIVGNPRRIVRGEIKVRVFGDLAVLNGPATNYGKNPDGTPVQVDAAVQQVLVRRGQGWVYVLTQMTPAGDPGPDPYRALAKR